MKSFGYCMCALLLHSAAPAFAQQQRVDPFLSSTEGGGSFEEEVAAVKELAAEGESSSAEPAKQPLNRFSSSMDRLLKSAGIDTSATDTNWGGFEESTQEAEDNYHSSFEWQMQNENAKALKKPEPFNNGLDYVEQKLKEFDSPEQDLEKEMRKYQRNGNDEDE